MARSLARSLAAALVVFGFLSVAATQARAKPADDAVAAQPDTVPEALPPAETVGKEGAPRPADLSYGVGLRLRYVSVPGWLLGLFTKNNVPLGSYSVAAEWFRRKGTFDFMVSFGYQNMSPSDGNWLGADPHQAATDTDFVQFRGLALWGLDASIVGHTYFNDWFGMHYGAGLGVALVPGKILRTSNGSPGCANNPGDVAQCHPIVCATGPCTEQQLAATELPNNGGLQADGPTTPHRFSDNNVPPAIPIINLVIGVDFRLPNVRGWEAKIEGGFYDAFFLGLGVGYTF
jgi:hypothetical protein